MKKEELDLYLKNHEYLKQIETEWEERKLEMLKEQYLSSEEGRNRLEKELSELVNGQHGQNLANDENDKKKLLESLLKLIKGQPLTDDEEANKNLLEKSLKQLTDDVWIGSRNATGLPAGAAWNPSIPKDIQNELNTAMKNNQCNEIRTPHGFYRITGDKDGNNTLYVDSRWLKEDYSPGNSTSQDYVNEIKKIIGDNENFKISDMQGEFKNESVEEFFYKADVDYGVRPANDFPQSRPH